MTTPHIPGAVRRRAAAAALRLLAVSASLAVAGAALTPAAATTHAASHPAQFRAVAARTAPTAAAGSLGMRPLALPGLTGTSYTVTLISGDRVTLAEAAPGRYTVAAAPSPGSGTQVGFWTQGNAAGITSLQAVPAGMLSLIRSGQVNPGLFDVRYLAAHGDTGPAARIPVTIQYAGHPDATALRHAAASLPGVTVLATAPGSNEVNVGVAAARAGAFWSALTGRAAAATAPAAFGPSAGLVGGATRVWLTGHQVTAAANPRPQDGQPVYQVTETFTRNTGPVYNEVCGAATFCFAYFVPALFGVAGSGQGQIYSADSGTCASYMPASPSPVCTALRITYSVPAGVYYGWAVSTFLTTDDSDGTLEQAVMQMDVPQFTVAGPTEIGVDADRAVPAEVTTPRRAAEYTMDGIATMEAFRSLPDGSYLAVSPGSLGNFWAVPTPAAEHVTIGSYHFSQMLTLGRPEVTAAVTAPTQLTLHPVYSCGAYTGAVQSPCSGTRFSGRQTLQLADAGQGTASDFSKIDARGKLVMIRAINCGQDPFPGGCGLLNFNFGYVMPQQLVNAQQAGAAGVLVDAGTDADGYSHSLPALVPPLAGAPAVPHLPFTEIDAAQAEAVLRLLATGPVRITIDDSGQTPYLYHLRFDQEAAIPSSLSHTVTSQQLAEVSGTYHAPSTGITAPLVQAFRPDESAAAVTSSIAAVAGPRSIPEYYGPLSPDLVWWLAGGTANSAPIQGGEFAMKVFDRPGSSTLDWYETPLALGAQPAVTVTAADQAQPGFSVNLCDGCREGSTFYPIFNLIPAADPTIDTGLPEGFLPGSIHMYDQNGQEIPATSQFGVATFQLPAQRERYRLVTPSTTWDFTSSAPASNQPPQGTNCIAAVLGSSAPCEADPLVFLRYDAGLSLTNTVTGPGAHQIQVTGYHQDPSAPAVTSLKLWTSTDGGTTWQPATVTGGHGGTFTATYTLPAASATDGYVSIKAQASDNAGNDITQTLTDAYAIAVATSAGTPGR